VSVFTETYDVFYNMYNTEYDLTAKMNLGKFIVCDFLIIIINTQLLLLQKSRFKTYTNRKS